MKTRIIIVSLFVALLACIPVQANTTVQLEGPAGTGIGADLIFSYTGLSATTGTINLSLSNVSSTSSDDLIILTFNAPEGVTGASLTSSTNPWLFDFNHDGINAGGFGMFDAYLFLANGLEPGQTDSMTIGLTGTGLDEMTEMDFLSLLSVGGLQKSTLAVFENPAYFGFSYAIPTSGQQPVPEPATLLLFGCGIIGLGGLKRWQKKA